MERRFTPPSIAAKKKRKGDKDKAHKVEEEKEEVSDTDSIDRMEEVVRATESSKSKSSDLFMTILDHGQQSQELSNSFLIDSGVHKTLLAEKHCKQVQGSSRYWRLEEMTTKAASPRCSRGWAGPPR